MARYIDADKLIEKWQNTLKDKNPDDLAYKCFTLFIDRLEKEPTADVVPKSEVERLRDDNNFLQDRRFKELSEVGQEVAREIFEEIDSKKIFLIDHAGNLGIVVRFKDIDELKKKYTESEDKE